MRYLRCPSCRGIPFLLLLLAMGLFSHSAYGWWMWTPGDTVDHPGYKPTQPIPFSHKLHSGQMKMPCEYCHNGARRSHSSVVPPMNTCMGCHKIVATDREPIKYLTEKYNKNEPIEWIKVHDLPDFVRFSHRIHVGNGMECQTCHGAVQEMEIVEQVAPLQMGWCIECHTEKGASVDCLTCHY